MNEDQINRIEKYLKGELTEEDKRSFEADMVKNPDLKRETIAMSKIMKGINIAFNQDLKAALQEKERTISPVSPKKTLRIGVITSIAAGIALIAVIYLYNFLPGPDLVKLYTEYYEPYPNIMEPVNRSLDYNNTAFFNYESGNYEAALEGFNRILSRNPEHEPTLFYAGISSLEMNKPEFALENFTKIIEMPEGKFTRPAIWYSAMSHLLQGNQKLAVESLNSLIRKEDKFARDAKELLREFR